MLDGLLGSSLPWWYWAALVVLLLAAPFAWGFLGLGSKAAQAPDDDKWRSSSTRWASLGDVKDLLVDQFGNNRITLGLLHGTKKWIAAKQNRSVMVLAPSGAGKTPRIVVPAVLRHHGPAVVASVKADVLHLTRHHRASQGRVWVFDPTGATGLVGCRWSPLLGIQRYSDAERAATWLLESSKVEGRGLEGQQYWDTLGRRCLAPMLFAAAKHNRSMADVGLWLSEGMDRLVDGLLEELGDTNASAAWKAHVNQDEKPKSSVVGTAWVILEAWTSDAVSDSVEVTSDSERPILDIDQLLDSNDTLYLVAPASEQALYTPIFETLVNAILRRCEALATRRGGLPLNPSLLLALDEAANIAPLRHLDQQASKGQGEGVLLLTVWQDFGQIVQIYGAARARTIQSNHWASVFLPGINDQETLRGLSEAIGTDMVKQTSYSHHRDGGSEQTSWAEKQVAPASWLRRLPVDEAIVISGRYPGIRVRVPGWFEDRDLRGRIDPQVASDYDAMFGPAKKVKVRR